MKSSLGILIPLTISNLFLSIILGVVSHVANLKIDDYIYYIIYGAFNTLLIYLFYKKYYFNVK